MTRSILILIADDDPAMRGMLGMSLRRQGFEVGECSDGKELIDRLQAARNGSRAPDLVVSDLRMPGLSGLDVLHWLKTWLPDVPLILITAFGDPHTHRRAAELGAAAVVDKPFDLQELQDHIVRVLAARPNG
ncbi:MAG TPA: response regulator [Polyangiales bacterium]|jgi:CheY-like chemotaxis protein|nr:response regulator [Polyangiales bacterium]